MATTPSTLDWEIPRTEEPGRLPSMGSQRVHRTEPLSVIANTPELSKIKIIFLFWSEFK